MQLFPILLIVIVLAADGGLRLFQPDPPPTAAQATLIAWMPVVMIVGTAWLMIAWCERRLSRGNAGSALGSAERAVRYGRMLLLVNHAFAILVFGWLDAVRSGMGDLILLDELVSIAPPLLGALGLWWAYYPIERRIRESLLIRRLDMGKPVYPMPSRVQYVLSQARTGMLILLVPILTILGLAETIQFAAMRWSDPETATRIANGATLVAAATVFVFAPLLMRGLLSVERLPDGPVRDSLLDICKRHGVRVRELLLWRTSGAMINAAVMGLVGRLRYVLVTDALVESMSSDQLKAVMAHEVGHVRRHHMPWLVVCFAAALFAALWIVELPLLALHGLGVNVHTGGHGMVASVMVVQLILALIAFGWISRRFERQADTFAVQHLSMAMPREEHCEDAYDDAAEQRDDDVQPGEPRVEPKAAAAMCGALEMIAHLNAVDPRRPSWRHGSIRWRQDYLTSIVGQRLDAIAIDRSIKYIKRAAAAVLALTLGAWMLM